MNAALPRRAAAAALALAVAVILAGCIGAGGQGDPRRGRQVADLWCSECHRVRPDQPSGARPGHLMPPPMVAPSFMAVAARPNTDAASLRRFMTDLHLPMPTYRLSEDEREDVIAHILSLR